MTRRFSPTAPHSAWRPQVRDKAGSIPLSYQPAYLDPLGRTLSFSLRKMF